MRKSVKLIITAAVVCVVILVSLVSIGLPSKTFIKARWHHAGFDRHGFRLAGNVQKTFETFGLSIDPDNGFPMVSNPLTSKAMRFGGNGGFFWEEKPCYAQSSNTGEDKQIEIKELAHYIENNYITQVFYACDLTTQNVYSSDYILANPEKATLSEPFQTALFVSPDKWNEYVIDRKGNKLMCFSPYNEGNSCTGYSTLKWVIPPGMEMRDAPSDIGNYGFDNPSGICVDDVGNIYVSDTGNSRILKYDENGVFSQNISAGLYLPTGIDFRSGKLYICDTGNMRIAVLDAQTGKIAFSIHDPGFSAPTSIAVDPSGDIWVGERSKDALFKFSGFSSLTPGMKLLEVNGVLTSQKFPRTLLSVELKKYSARRNGKVVKIKPYVQSIDGVAMIPLKFTFDNLLKDRNRGNADQFKIEFEPNTKRCMITVPEFPIGGQARYNARCVEFEVGSGIATLDGKPVKLASKVEIIDGAIFVPISSLVDLFDVELSIKEPKTEPQSRYTVYHMVFPPFK